MTRLVTIERYFDPSRAYVARSLLEQHGIFAILPDEHTYAVSPWYLFALGGLRLMVPDIEEEEARRLLSYEQQGSYEHCPECGGENFVRHAGIEALILFPYAAVCPSQVIRKRTCLDCKHTWSARPIPMLHKATLIFLLGSLIVINLLP